VGNIDLLFQSVQLRILEYFPPIATEILLVRLGSFPIASLFVSGRHFDWRALVPGANGTTGKQEHTGKREGRYTVPADSNLCLRIAR
ncbi:MAG: hypothetical protein DMG96_22275, partial [Acidobacteria bacterium]